MSEPEREEMKDDEELTKVKECVQKLFYKKIRNQMIGLRNKHEFSGAEDKVSLALFKIIGLATLLKFVR